MKTKAKPEFGSFQPDALTEEKVASIVQHKHEPGTPLTEEMSEQLAKLKAAGDEEINYSDIPELSDEQLGEFSHLQPSSLWLKRRLQPNLKKAS